MTIKISEAYVPRPIRFLERLTVDGWRMKVYGIAYEEETPGQELVEAAKSQTANYLGELETGHTTYGVGFLGIHQGRGANQVFLDLWINENELLHAVFISDPVLPSSLQPAPKDHNSVCVWDLYVQAFEREAWLNCVLNNPHGPDLNAYLDEQLNTDV